MRGPPPPSGPPAPQTPAADLPSAAVADAVTGGNTDECGKFFVTRYVLAPVSTKSTLIASNIVKRRKKKLRRLRSKENDGDDEKREMKKRCAMG